MYEESDRSGNSNSNSNSFRDLRRKVHYEYTLLSGSSMYNGHRNKRKEEPNMTSLSVFRYRYQTQEQTCAYCEPDDFLCLNSDGDG